MKSIKLATCTVDVDENTSKQDIEKACPNFFRRGFGKRETFTMHRGFLIVRHTVGNPSDARHGHLYGRLTAVYLFAEFDGHKDTLCVSSGHKLESIRDAKKLIDNILKHQKYEYGMIYSQERYRGNYL